MRYPFLLGLTCLVFGLVTGCGEPETANLKDANAEYQLATEAMEAGSFDEALGHFSAAIDAGGLNPDQYGDSMIRRAECYAKSGNFAAAHADLDSAEMGADLDRVFATRSFVFSKEGKTKEASAAMSKAKKENRSVKAIK